MSTNLHASWMIVSIIVDNTVSNNLLFTHTTLLLCRLKKVFFQNLKTFWVFYLKTLCTISMFFLWKEFAVQSLLATMTSKAFLVINLPKSSTPIFGEFHMTMITKLWNWIASSLRYVFESSWNYSKHFQLLNIKGAKNHFFLKKELNNSV